MSTVVAGWLCTCLGIKSSLDSGIRCAPVTGVEKPFLRGIQSSEPSFILTSTVSSTEAMARFKRRHEAIPERPRRFEASIRKDCNCQKGNWLGDKHDYLPTWNSILGGRRGSGGCSCGDGDTSRNRDFWVRAFAPPGRCGLHPFCYLEVRPRKRPRIGAQGTAVCG